MPDQEKPYRVYKGGRAKGKVPAPPGVKGWPARGGVEAPGSTENGKKPSRLRRHWGRIVGLALVGIILFLIAWGLAGYFSFKGGVEAANRRLPRSARLTLTHQGGSLLGKATTVLVLGTDHSTTGGRSGDDHSDSIMLVRADPKHHRIAYLSIPRDLRVDIPGHGSGKINAAYQIGGPALAVQTVRELTGLPVNHLALVDFGNFKDLIDRIGGVTVDVPRAIVSNRFDCPFKTQAQCLAWKGWRFARGKQHMDGERALIYSRIRENRLDRSETDVTRGERQQAVLQALASKLASLGTFFQLPFIGGDLLKPLSSDLGPFEFLQLGWVKFRAPGGRVLHCRLGGEPSTVGGQSVIVPTEENRNVIAMVAGDSAPQPPTPGSGAYGPGCSVGSSRLGSR